MCTSQRFLSLWGKVLSQESLQFTALMRYWCIIILHHQSRWSGQVTLSHYQWTADSALFLLLLLSGNSRSIINSVLWAGGTGVPSVECACLHVCLYTYESWPDAPDYKHTSDITMKLCSLECRNADWSACSTSRELDITFGKVALYIVVKKLNRHIVTGTPSHRLT